MLPQLTPKMQHYLGCCKKMKDAEALKKRGVTYPDHAGRLPLGSAMGVRRSNAIVETLLSAASKEDVELELNWASGNGATPLHEAIAHQDEYLTQLFLDHGASATGPPRTAIELPSSSCAYCRPTEGTKPPL